MYDRDTIKSLIEVCVYKENKKLFAEIYTSGDLDAFEPIECGTLLGDLLSYQYSFFDKYKSGAFETEFFLDGLNKEVAEFELEDRLKYDFKCENDVEFLMLNWDSLTLYELKIWNFVNDVINYCEKKNIKLDTNYLEYFMELALISLPEKRLVIRDDKTANIKENDWLFEWYENYNHFELFDSYIGKFNGSRLYLYRMDSIAELVLVLLYEIVKNGKMIKKCENCNKLFVPIKSDEKYCMRMYDNKSCKAIANFKVRKQTYSSNTLSKKYNSISTLLSNKLNKSNLTDDQIKKLEKELMDFRKEAKEFKNLLKKGLKTEDEYLNWLDSFKSGKKEVKNNGQHHEKDNENR